MMSQINVNCVKD